MDDASWHLLAHHELKQEAYDAGTLTLHSAARNILLTHLFQQRRNLLHDESAQDTQFNNK